MLAKIFGVILIVIGGSFALGTLFPLIGSLVSLAIVLIKLLIACAIALFGYRLVTRESY